MDAIGENSYTVKFDDGKLSPVNVERIYTVSRESNISSKSKRGKNAHKNFKKRAKKRKLRDIHDDNSNTDISNNDADGQGPPKRLRQSL